MSGRGSPRIDQPVVESDWLSWLHNTEDIWGEDGSATTHVKHAPIDRPFQPELSQQDSEADGFAPPSSDAFTEDTSWLSSSGYYGAPSDSSIG
ncbi:hypothetical protein ACHAO7_011562, partial [Fusarium culmorum]